MRKRFSIATWIVQTLKSYTKKPKNSKKPNPKLDIILAFRFFLIEIGIVIFGSNPNSSLVITKKMSIIVFKRTKLEIWTFIKRIQFRCLVREKERETDNLCIVLSLIRWLAFCLQTTLISLSHDDKLNKFNIYYLEELKYQFLHTCFVS